MSSALKAATAVPEASAVGASAQASTAEEAEARGYGCVVARLLCCTVACLTLATAADKLATGRNQLKQLRPLQQALLGLPQSEILSQLPLLGTTLNMS